MIFSGTLALDPALHAACTDTLRSRLADLERRRRSPAPAVERVLETWHGDAAEHFRSRWEEWDRGAVRVVEQLAAGISALDRVRADVVATDGACAERPVRLAGRLG